MSFWGQFETTSTLSFLFVKKWKSIFVFFEGREKGKKVREGQTTQRGLGLFLNFLRGRGRGIKGQATKEWLGTHPAKLKGNTQNKELKIRRD